MQAWFHDGQGRRKLQKIEGAPASRGTLGYWQGHLKNISRKCFPSYHTIDVPYRNCTFLTKLFLKTSKFPNKKGTFDVNLVFTATLAWTKRALFITKKGKYWGGVGARAPCAPRFLRPWRWRNSFSRNRVCEIWMVAHERLYWIFTFFSLSQSVERSSTHWRSEIFSREAQFIFT